MTQSLAASPDTPVTDGIPASGSTPVSRQVILDRRNGIFGYELVDGSGAAPTVDTDAQLLAHALSLAASKTLAERRMLFVRCSFATLAGDGIEAVDPGRVVLDVVLPTGLDASQIVVAAGRLAQLKQRGYRLAFSHDVLSSAWRSWLAQASFLRLDLARLPGPAVPAVTRAALAGHARVIACGVDTEAQHRVAADLGVELFQGSWFSHPLLIKSQTMRPNQAIILELIALLRREADMSEIEALLKRDPALSFNLLRFINSGAFGLDHQVSSFRSAVLMVGMQRLLRWATVLMATSRAGAPALGYTAVVRGRLMELLAAELLSPEECDQAFVVGVFSLLDAMTGLPLARVLDGLALPEPVMHALLNRTGLFEPFMALTEACEAANDEAFATHADSLLLSGHQVNMAHLQALAWAEDLLAT
jgi:c-di-GMP-related signal transduction protein